MKTSLYTSILVALWSSACAAQTAPGASLPAGQAQATADTAAADSAAPADGSAVDSQVAEAAGTVVAPDTDLADTQPGDSSADTAKALQAPDIRARYEQLGMVPVGDSPAQFTKTIKEETVRWGKIVRERNLTAN